MKKVLIVLTAMGLAIPSMAVVISEGTHEIGFSGSIDTESAQGTDVAFDLKYGVYVMDQWALGGAFGIADNDIATQYDVGLFTEYNWDLGTEWVPYVGLNLAWSGSDLDAIDDSLDGVVFTPNVGLKHFFNSSVAGFVQLNYDIASEDIYTNNDGNAEDQNLGFQLGLRVYLGQ